MRSAVAFLTVYGAIGSAPSTCENDGDAQALLQSKKVVRKHMQSSDSGALLESMQQVALSLTKDSSVSMTPEEVNAAIAEASAALVTMFPGLAEQHTLAQRETTHALGAIDACHQQHGNGARTGREERVAATFAAIHDCEETLVAAQEEQERACQGQGVQANCECTEARTAVTDTRVLCAAETDRYEAVFCENHMFCGMLHECHAQEVSVYQALVNDLEEAMHSRQQQFVQLTQSNCILDLITNAMLSGTPIDHSALASCSLNIDLSALTLTFPDAPADPRICHVPEDGEPQCEFDSDDLVCGAGSPDGCHCSQVQLQGLYSAGPVIRCDDGIDVRRTTDQNSCPSGWKIFSPQSQADWEVLHSALGDHSHHIGNPAGVQSNWPSSPWLIVDVSRSDSTAYPVPQNQRPAMNSANSGAAAWHTSDGSPFWLREAAWGQPDGNFNANCFLDIYNLNPEDMGFDDNNCHPHSSSYLCQREDFYGQTADGCPRDNSNGAGRFDDTHQWSDHQATSDFSGNVIATEAHSHSGTTASVRCCSMDGSSCSTSGLDGGCQAGKTLAEAHAICAANDERLCTEHEMADNVCCNTGCWFNHHAVWVTPSTLGSNPRADTKCPFNNGDRLFREPSGGSSSITRAECFAQCQTTEGCNHYSWGQHGGANVCMGCSTLDHAQHHNGFTAYDM